jgi:hypothetical protein
MKKRAKINKSASDDVFDSMGSAATGMGVAIGVLKAAKRAGAPGFRGSRVYAKEIRAWLELHPEIAKAKDNSWDAKLKAERHRKLKLENDETEKTLIKREWMAERVHLAAGKVDAFRQKSEAEHPLLFAAAAGDVAACRAVVRKIWDEVMASLNTLEKDFRE